MEIAMRIKLKLGTGEQLSISSEISMLENDL